MNMKKLMRSYDADDILHFIGLAQRRSFLGALLPALGLLTAGAVIGAGIGLAFAPSSGQRLRQDVGGRLDQLRDRVKTNVDQYKNGESRTISAQT
jgi:hypothetical protein